nr:retrovirus-related Pol polyprotein from transposon TNT 1-94 [Tanacetum cinerariifolium]
MQTQTSNTLHNAIMEAGGKDRPPMLAPDKEVLISEGSFVTTTETYMENYKNVSQEIHDQLNPEAEAVQIILTRIDNNIYSTVDACLNACEMWKAIERSQQAATKNRGKAIVNSLSPIYDQEPSMVVEDGEIANQDNSLRINRDAVYDNQRLGHVAGARKTVGTTVVQKSGIQCYNCKEFRHIAKECQKPKRAKDATYHKEKMLLCKQGEAIIQLNAEQANWRDDTDDESEDQELEAHYMYMVQIQENDDDDLVNERELLASLIEKLKCKIDDSKNRNKFLETSNKVLVEKLKETNKLMYTDLKKFHAELYRRNDVENASKFFNEIDRLSREYYYADHMNAILDEVTNFQCDYLEMLEKCECLKKELSMSKMMSKSFEALQKHAINLEIDLQQCQEKIKNDKSFKENQSKEFPKEREQYFEIQDLKAQLQDKGIAIRKPTIFLDSLERKDFSKSKPVTKNNVSNDFSKPVIAQILPPNKKSILKNTNVLASGMYKLHTEPTQTRTSQLPYDYRKTNKRVSFSIGVISTTSVSRPLLKSNPIEDRVMLNNSQRKKHEVEDHHRNVKFSKNKTSVTACNDSLNAKTSNVNFVCATCGKYVLNVKHDMCVLKSRNGVNSRTKMPIVVPVSTREPKRTVKQYVAKPLRKTVALESTNQKPKNTTRKLYECVSQACKIFLFIVDSRCSKHMTRNFKLLINFVEKFLGTVKFGNDQIIPIFGYGDLGNDLLTSSRGTDLYSITLQDTNSPNLICLMAKATSSQAWLWHRRLSHLNFDTISLLSKNDIMIGLPKLKFVKDHLCSSWILHQTSIAQTPKQNGAVKRQNRTLFEAARTMLSAAKIPLFFWAEAIATACFTQNHSLVTPRHEKTPYHIINDRKPSVKFFNIFGSLCYIFRDGENLDKMKEKGDACIFVGYSTQSRAYKVFNKRTRVIVETIHVNFDELPQMA